MKRVIGSALALALLCAVAALAKAQGGPDVTGEWDMTINSPQGESKVLLKLKKEGDKLSGAAKNARGERPLTSVELKGNDITMMMTIQFQGSDMVITYTGKVENDSMKGDADFGGLAQGDWSAVRHKEGPATPATPASPANPATPESAAKPANPASPATPAGAATLTGVWNFTVETPNGTGNPVITFKQDGENLSGTYKGQLGEYPVTGTLKGSDATFRIKVNVQGQDLEITFKGMLEGKDSMKGKAQFGDFGEGNWSATRKN